MKIINKIIQAFRDLFALPKYASAIRVGNNWILNEPRVVRGIGNWLSLDSPCEQYTIEVTKSDLVMLVETSIDTSKKLYDMISKDKESEIWTITIPCYGKLSIDDTLLMDMAKLLAKAKKISVPDIAIHEVTVFIAVRLRIKWEDSDTLSLPMSLYSRFLACLNEEKLGGRGRFFPSPKSIEKVLV